MNPPVATLTIFHIFLDILLAGLLVVLHFISTPQGAFAKRPWKVLVTVGFAWRPRPESLFRFRIAISQVKTSTTKLVCFYVTLLVFWIAEDLGVINPNHWLRYLGWAFVILWLLV